MTEVIKFDRIVSVNSEVQGHGAQNILDGEIRPNKNWMCESGTEKAVLILQLERAAVLSSIHVGNAHSAFVEVLVGRAADSGDQFESLVPMSSFMNPHDSKTGTNPNRTRFFTKEDFNKSTSGKSWDRIKIVCSQPFNKHVRYGLCFLKVQGVSEAKKVEIPTKTEDKGEITVGSFFKKLRKSKEEKPLTVSEQIKEAEKESSLAKHSPISIAKMTEKMSSEKKAKPMKESKEKERKDGRSGHGQKEEERRDRTHGGGKDENKNKDKSPSDRRKSEKEIGESKKKGKESAKRKKEGDDENDETIGKRRKKERERSKKRRAFEKLMEDVVLVISGFKNPLRGDIRTKALEMGAKYSSDWEPHCTHLVCAYENTPKCQQVRGKGKIVKKEWVESCHKDRKRYPWRRFALVAGDAKKAESEEEVEEEIEEEEKESEVEEKMQGASTSSVTFSQEESSGAEGSSKTIEDVGSCDDYGAATDEDEDEEEKKIVDTSDYPMPFLPDIFSLKTFFLDAGLRGRAVLERYVIAYNGVLTETFDEKVDYYVTEKGGGLVEVFRKKAPNVVVVKPSWIWEINSEQKMVPTTSHLVK